MGKLEGRVALVTGAASGLGRASATLFAEEGASVVFADVAAEGAEIAARAVDATGARTHAEALDVTDYAACERVVAATVERFGRLDVLMTCAGIGDSAPLKHLDSATFERTLGVNLVGTFNCVKAAFLALGERGGSVITLGSVSGVIASSGFAAYGASKAGVIHMTRILALEGANQGIRVNAISPSWIWTPMVKKALGKFFPGQPDEVIQQYLTRMAPLGRMGRLEDVARAALYLASDDSAFMTGQDLVLDGGISLGPTAQ